VKQRLALTLALIGALACAAAAVSCRPARGLDGRPARVEKPDSEKSAKELRKDVRALKAQIKVKEALIEQREIEKLQAYATALGIGLLAVAVVLVFVAIFTPIKKRAIVGVVACVGLSMLCFFFAREIAPRMGLGGFIIALVVLAGLGVAAVYYVARNWKKLKAGFAVTSKVADKLGDKLKGEADEARDKIEAFLDELRNTRDLTREQLKRLRDELRGE